MPTTDIVMPIDTAGRAPEGLPAKSCSPPSVRGFRVRITYFEKPETSIVRTTSPARAKHLHWESARDVGYMVGHKHLTVTRAPEYDAAKLIKDRCYSEDFARTVLAENIYDQHQVDAIADASVAVGLCIGGGTVIALGFIVLMMCLRGSGNRSRNGRGVS